MLLSTVGEYKRADSGSDISTSPTSRSSISGDSEGFHRTDAPVWHDVRRKEMLKLYPEIQSLYGYDHWSAVFCTATVFLQFLGVYLCRDLPFPYLLMATYVFSGTLNHSLVLALHEISHNTFFKSPLANKWFGFFANLPIGLPMSITFKRYHNEHHWGLAVEGVDLDLPTATEARVFNSKFGRFFWMLLQPLFYTLRPVFVKPKSITFDEVINWVIQMIFDFFVVYFFGAHGIFYLLGGAILGMGFHPISGHFIAEHYEFFPNQETASYYGWGNWITYNVGWHVEHHDFPRIPGRLLPKLHAIAPEFYKNLKSHKSWSGVLWNFCFGGKVTLWNRIVRESPQGRVKVH